MNLYKKLYQPAYLYAVRRYRNGATVEQHDQNVRMLEEIAKAIELNS